MKAQGLPLNFIILGALALLVLVVAVAFFMSGTQTLTTGMTEHQLQQKCDSVCNDINRIVRASANSADDCSEGTTETNDCLPSRAQNLAFSFLKDKYEIPGFSGTCDDVMFCNVQFADFTSCTIDWIENPEEETTVADVTCQ